MSAHVMQLFKEIGSEAAVLLHDLQNSLHSQKTKLTAYAQQQREVSFCLTWKENCFKTSSNCGFSFWKEEFVNIFM